VALGFHQQARGFRKLGLDAISVNHPDVGEDRLIEHSSHLVAGLLI
jgi:hypothetical protein